MVGQKKTVIIGVEYPVHYRAVQEGLVRLGPVQPCHLHHRWFGSSFFGFPVRRHSRKPHLLTLCTPN